MNKQTDLRVIRTRQMIKEAFLELMDTIGFTKITIENLTKKAFISRNTFYLHYTDKWDLLDKLENQVLEGIRENVMKLPFDEFGKGKINADKLQEVMQYIFTYVKANHNFFRLMMSDKGDPAFLHKMGETIRSVMNEKGIINRLKIPQGYMVAVIVGVQTNIIGEWLRSGMKETPEEVAEIVMMIFKDVPKNILAD